MSILGYTKGFGFNFWSGNILRLWVQCLMEAYGKQPVNVSVAVQCCFPLSLCKSQFKKYSSVRIKKDVAGLIFCIICIAYTGYGERKGMFPSVSLPLLSSIHIFFLTFLQKYQRSYYISCLIEKKWLSTGTGTQSMLSDSIN